MSTNKQLASFILLLLAFPVIGYIVLLEPCDRDDYLAVSSGRIRGKWRAVNDQSSVEFTRLCNGLVEFEILMEESPNGEFRSGSFVVGDTQHEFSVVDLEDLPVGMEMIIPAEFIQFSTPPSFLTEHSYGDFIEMQRGYCVLPLAPDLLFVFLGNNLDGSSTGFSYSRQ